MTELAKKNLVISSKKEPSGKMKGMFGILIFAAFGVLIWVNRTALFGGRIDLTSDPSGALVIFDADTGKEIVTVTPDIVPVGPGVHTWTAYHSIYETRSGVVEVLKGETVPLFIQLIPLS